MHRVEHKPSFSVAQQKQQPNNPEAIVCMFGVEKKAILETIVSAIVRRVASWYMCWVEYKPPITTM